MIIRLFIIFTVFLNISGCVNARVNEDAYEGFFNFEHVQSAINYLENPTKANLKLVANTKAMKHLKNHSDRTGYYSKTATVEEISLDLLSKSITQQELTKTKNLVGIVAADRDMQQYCLAQTKLYLPEDFNFIGHLFFTWGYDIGVSMDENASLNMAHNTFHNSVDEVWYYCIHELSHVGFQQYHRFPELAKVTTGTQLFELVQYLSVLEGSAVYAAYEARANNRDLSDPDYVALENAETMKTFTKEYFHIYHQIASIGSRKLTEDDWNLLNNLSDGKRLWYRVGAAMAKKIDENLGRKAYKKVIKQGPQAFFDAYEKLL